MLGIVPQPRPAANARGPNCIPHKPRPGPFVWSGPCLVRGKHVGRRPVTNPPAAVFHRQKAAARDQRVPGGCRLSKKDASPPFAERLSCIVGRAISPAAPFAPPPLYHTKPPACRKSTTGRFSVSFSGCFTAGPARGAGGGCGCRSSRARRRSCPPCTQASLRGRRAAPASAGTCAAG